MPLTFSRSSRHAGNRRHDPSLETLVKKMGGVAGAVRRIIQKRPVVTASQVYAAIEDEHPQLRPANGQVEAIIQQMLDRRLLEMKPNTRKIRTYKWSPKARVKKQAAATQQNLL